MESLITSGLTQLGAIGILIAVLFWNSKNLSTTLEKVNQSHVSDLKEMHCMTLKALEENSSALVSLKVLIETKLK